MGPRAAFAHVLLALQDLGLLHVAAVRCPVAEGRAQLARSEARRRARLVRFEAEVDAALAGLGVTQADGGEPAPLVEPAPPTPPPWSAWLRRVRTLRRALREHAARMTALTEEQALLDKYRPLLDTLAAFDLPADRDAHLTAFQVVLRADQRGSLGPLGSALEEALGGAVVLVSRTLASGELWLLVVVARSAASRVERLLADSHVQEVRLPGVYGPSALHAAPRMRARLREIPAQLASARTELAALAAAHRAELVRAKRVAEDEIRRADAAHAAGRTAHAFVIEGWLPSARQSRFARDLTRRLGDVVTVEVMEEEPWADEAVPVVLSNPRLFRPFEVVTRLLPLPTYGTIDPTPFVAVFFPMFFGLILGDVGYGLVLGMLAVELRRRAARGSILQAIARICGACASFTVLFGVAFGELFGDLGAHVLGLRPVLFDRGERVVSFLALALALGAVHIALGLVLGVIANVHGHRRAAAGRAVSAVMLALVVAGALAAADALPAALLVPVGVALLAALVVLVVLEGVVGPIELLMTLGHVLSYARIMALGTASVMLAVVANRMVGSLGSVAVGVLFALVFHVVNFALGLLGPTIHSLRLHYVEFFGTFFSPGGQRYQPLAHARAGETATT